MVIKELVDIVEKLKKIATMENTINDTRLKTV